MLAAIAHQRLRELGSLVEGYLLKQIAVYPEAGPEMASQLFNVLSNCDTITYNERGTGNAYALLHFLDRYYRFHLTFDLLARNNLMPLKRRGIDVLDIGTGPGPSMFAVSDFYSEQFADLHSAATIGEQRPTFTIDYAEQSREFRDWLHYFTEFANYYTTARQWNVPYGGGTFGDFGAIEFNQQITSWVQDDDDDYEPKRYVRPHRFDLVILSNFLTTRAMVEKYRKQLRDCARFLRHGGILLVVGATARSTKYRPIYDAISEAILERRYGSRKFSAWCERVDIRPDVLSYKWGDPCGAVVRKHFAVVYDALRQRYSDLISDGAAIRLEPWAARDCNTTKEWQVLVFRKFARTRPSYRGQKRKLVDAV